jgi:hypothetical protein
MYPFPSPTLMKNSCNRLISQYFNTTKNTREPLIDTQAPARDIVGWGYFY